MTQTIGPWGRLPVEMRELPQWVVSGADKAPMAVDDNNVLRLVSVTRPGDWMTFERAVAVAWMYRDLVTTCTTAQGQVITRTGLDIGFVLQEGDPFSCIDLDVKDAETHPDKPAMWSTVEQFDKYMSIIKTMDSYTERSRSGKGIHTWVIGNIGRGFRRDGVEVYSRERYIICTGDVYVDKPVADRDTILQNMVSQMRPIGAAVQLEEHPPEHDDWYIFQIAATAGNADKFWALWRGQWQDLGFPSQSEADLALMSMFTFYSDSNSQCRSLFRASALGKREKTTKNDYHVNKLLSLIRGRQASEQAADIGAIMAGNRLRDDMRSGPTLAEAISEAQGGALGIELHREISNLGEPGQGDPPAIPPPPAVALAQLAPVPGRVADAGASGMPWPPGFVGTVAKFIYASSYLPVKEISIVSALGLMAGLCGKAWHIPHSGLNLYIILVARSAIGKEALHSGIATLVTHCAKQYPFFGNFVDFTEYVSGPALIKACMQQPSLVNVSGEWGRRLKRLADEDGRDGPLQTLRTQMTNLYQKSGPQSIAGGLGYSNADSNVASVAGVAYSMIGESTPGSFYQSLTPSMMEDGFLSRFLVVEYDGDRMFPPETTLTEPDENLGRALVDIATQAYDCIGRGDSTQVGRNEEAATIMKAFDLEAHGQITSTDDESRRQMWNRASLKALRVAALLAVGDNYLSPCITKAHIEWAIQIVRNDIGMMSKRMESGDVGSGDNARERKLVAILRDYMLKTTLPKSYRVPAKMHADGIIPRVYLEARIAQVASFANHKFGYKRALDETIGHAIANGWLRESKADKISEAYNHYGKAYMVIDLPDYEQQGKK